VHKHLWDTQRTDDRVGSPWISLMITNCSEVVVLMMPDTLRSRSVVEAADVGNLRGVEVIQAGDDGREPAKAEFAPVVTPNQPLDDFKVVLSLAHCAIDRNAMPVRNRSGMGIWIDTFPFGAHTHAGHISFPYMF